MAGRKMFLPDREVLSESRRWPSELQVLWHGHWQPQVGPLSGIDIAPTSSTVPSSTQLLGVLLWLFVPLYRGKKSTYLKSQKSTSGLRLWPSWNLCVGNSSISSVNLAAALLTPRGSATCRGWHQSSVTSFPSSSENFHSRLNFWRQWNIQGCAFRRKGLWLSWGCWPAWKERRFSEPKTVLGNGDR